jgi:ParB-like chromosome segregation protein Spo0J
MSKSHQVIQIAMSGIAVPPGRLRALRPEIVEQLAESMKKEGGLLQPIVVRPRKGGDYWLVAGRHRLMAAIKLKWKTIACTIFEGMEADEVELAEVDENLIRANLSPAEEAAHIGRRKELYGRRHPEKKHGGDRKSAKAKSSSPNENLKPFVDDTAKKTGKGRSTIARKAARAKVVVLPEITGTSLDKGSEIDALAKLPEEKQRSLAEAARRGEKVSAITARSAYDPENPKMSDGSGKARSKPSRRKKADPAPTLEPRAWLKSTPQEREAFVKAVGRRDLEDAFNAIEPGYALTRCPLKQTWNAATPHERLAFAREYHDVIKTLGWQQKW